jgi:hypothetical protein
LIAIIVLAAKHCRAERAARAQSKLKGTGENAARNKRRKRKRQNYSFQDLLLYKSVPCAFVTSLSVVSFFS